MLSLASSLTGFALQCRDGAIGQVKELYFDDQFWTIRYLVVDTGSWLVDRQVLISPNAVTGIRNLERHVIVDHTRQQIADSPSIDADRPVSRQAEEDYHGYYGWPSYWEGSHTWGSSPFPPRQGGRLSDTGVALPWDVHLRSTKQVVGYHIHAADGAIGHVEDFLVDSESWAIRYLVVNAGHWWHGHRVLIAPKWVDAINWPGSLVRVALTREFIHSSPVFDQQALLSRQYEADLHVHYGRPGYWEDESAFQDTAPPYWT